MRRCTRLSRGPITARSASRPSATPTAIGHDRARERAGRRIGEPQPRARRPRRSRRSGSAPETRSARRRHRRRAPAAAPRARRRAPRSIGPIGSGSAMLGQRRELPRDRQRHAGERDAGELEPDRSDVRRGAAVAEQRGQHRRALDRPLGIGDRLDVFGELAVVRLAVVDRPQAMAAAAQRVGGARSASRCARRAAAACAAGTPQ